MTVVVADAQALRASWDPTASRVNTVGPGFVPTAADADVHQQQMRERSHARAVLGVVPTPDDFVETVVAVASDLFARISGGFIPVDGGASMT